ncbi:hypothetical protein AVEN_228946-1 [Araneus ventricosus]|uniref:Mos1 transposase HTH domain-containing protein n=1 Tax=Araneus ventricosus TaxID=182803 RepID=A0A4Y2IFS6_ARAVE|nr:hypothetical protein AVEN_228946-1 [Araneus ventricosus]
MALVITSSTVEEQQAMIRFLFAKGNKVGKIHSELVGVYRKDCIDRTNAGRWCKMFQDGRRILVDEVRSGRPVFPSSSSIFDEIDNVKRENRRTTLNEIKERCNISYGSAWDILHEKLGYRKVCSRWVPEQLSEQHTGCRMACSQNFCSGSTRKVISVWRVLLQEMKPWPYT